VGAILRKVKEESSFLKKRSKRLLFLVLRQDPAMASEIGVAEEQTSFHRLQLRTMILGSFKRMTGELRDQGRFACAGG
jgi:hypothetical protein